MEGGYVIKYKYTPFYIIVDNIVHIEMKVSGMFYQIEELHSLTSSSFHVIRLEK